MKRTYYFPDSIPEQLKWLYNFKAKIAIEGPGLGFSPAQITALQAYCDLIIASILAADQGMKDAQQLVSDRDNTIKTNMDKLRPEIQTIKDKTTYDEGIGKTLGIIGSEIKVDYDKVKTVIKLKKTQEGVDVKFTKEHCEGGRIYCQRGKETEFTFVAQVTHPHYIDTRPNADEMPSEVRKYKIILVHKDKEVGLDSDIAEITI